MSDPSDDATALLAGPWNAAAMSTRLMHLRGRLLVPPEVQTLVRDVLRYCPTPPDADQLTVFLTERIRDERIRTERPPLLDPQTDLAALCRLLDIDSAELSWFADTQARERRASGPLQHYRWQTLPKRDGLRLVAAPKPRLKEIQRRLLRHVLSAIPLHDAAHGAVPGRSVRSAILPHVAAPVVIRLDLESFFPTISATRIRGMLRAVGMGETVAEVIAGLCTTSVPVAAWRMLPRPTQASGLDAYHRLGSLMRTPHIAQGAPTSPALANAIAYRLDRRLAGLGHRFATTYTRYVDDLTFSGTGLLQAHRHRFLAAAHDVVRAEGFRVAEQKTAVLTHGGRLSALGAVFNDHPSLPRPERDRLRAIVHNCVVHGGLSQARGHPLFREQLLGRIAALGALDPPSGAKLRARYDAISWD